MEEQKRFQSIWGKCDKPVMVFQRRDQVYHMVYRNELALYVCPNGAPALDYINEVLCAPLTESTQLFCHAGEKVYSPVIFQWEEFQVCLLNDATVYYQENKRALDEALMASRAKTSFLSEMSHDIRTPMGAIIGMTDIALMQEEIPGKVKECLSKIKTASGHMMSLLNEVLDMSRIESGKILLQPEPVDIADLLHEILIVAKPQADAGKLHFRFEMGRMDQERIMVDGVRLKQICINILSNAIKFTPAGGHVDMYLDVADTEKPEQVLMTLRIHDTGMGMSPEFMKKLFTPFEREEKSTVNKIQGTGLGMAITKNLVELMGGMIRVESVPKEGTCFTLEIPFQAAENNLDAYKKALAGKRVLVLTAGAEQGSHIQTILKKLDMEGELATDAMDVVSCLNEALLEDREYYAFLTVDRVPGMDLMQFLPDVRKRMGVDFPILMLSESDWGQVEYLYTRSGVDDFIPMPLFASRLCAALYAFTREGKLEKEQGDSTLKYDFGNKRLLLVEDNEINREIEQEILGMSGIQITVAEDGQQAVDRFRESTPFYYDMILMDIQMPVMNGLDATRTIRDMDREDAQEIPIIAMTANAFVEDVKNSLDAGMNAHLPKPFDIEQVFSTMGMFLERGHT
ncbi:MAG: response regulator [bacterium]|nr:response regulator [bacterium]MCM1375503.1 response regulator [Muribaculum sp.]